MARYLLMNAANQAAHNREVTVSNVTHIPRAASPEEVQQLVRALQEQGHYSVDEMNEHDACLHLSGSTWISVFDEYVSGSGEFVGKVITLIWESSPQSVTQFLFAKRGKPEVVHLDTAIA